MDKPRGVDILHPLAELSWVECGELPPEASQVKQCVFLEGKIFVAGGLVQSEAPDHARIFVSSSDMSQWSTIVTPVQEFALSTYRSQLVLVGGIETSTKQVTNKLYSLDPAETETGWQESLPPMPTRRFSASAVNTDSPEYLVVAGGVGKDFQKVATVEVLSKEQWMTVQPLPVKCYKMNCALNHGKLYVLVREFLADTKEESTGYVCEIKSLQYSSRSLWTKFQVPLPSASIAPFGEHLVTFGGLRMHVFDPVIFALSHFTGSFINAGNLSPKSAGGCPMVLPTGELMVLSGGHSANQTRNFIATVVKGSLKMSPYHPNKEFSYSALTKLEGVGIKVVSSLAMKFKYQEHVAGNPLRGDRSSELDLAIKQLEKVGCSSPPTWNSLFKALKTLGLKDLASEIKDFFGDRSLNHLCLTVVVSHLKKHGCMSADQVCAILPDYVPTVIKQQIARKYRVHTGLLE